MFDYVTVYFNPCASDLCMQGHSRAIKGIIFRLRSGMHPALQFSDCRCIYYRDLLVGFDKPALFLANHLLNPKYRRIRTANRLQGLSWPS